MIINKIAVGNANEAFVEERLKPNFNIIFSLDNNKGKTIIMQSAMYALGNEPIFPASFPYKDYYHYIDLTLDNGNNLICCRLRDEFFIQTNGTMHLLNGVSELKRLLNKSGFSFPIIMKDGREKMVDPVLFYQLFFVGQDENKTSNIIKNGYYKKDDFIEMIYSLKGVDFVSENLPHEKDIKKEIDNLLTKKKNILKEQQIFNEKNSSSSISSLSIDKEVINDIKNKTEEITNKIVVLSNERNRFINKCNNIKSVLDQLNSLKIRINGSKLRCSDCGSNNIEFVSESEGFSFDISDDITRNDIEINLKEKVESYCEEIEKRTKEINELQESMHLLIGANKTINYEDVIYYAFLINEHKDYDRELFEIQNKLDSLKNQIKNFKQYSSDTKDKKTTIKNNIVTKMNEINKIIDPSSNNILDIFTKQDLTYSGCEEAIYYLSRLYAVQDCLCHNYPIIMDHFRAGELSSNKEQTVLGLFKKLSNQIIFTVTLKNEESNKYLKFNDINVIDYSGNDSNHILNAKYVENFKALLSKMKIRI